MGTASKNDDFGRVGTEKRTGCGLVAGDLMDGEAGPAQDQSQFVQTVQTNRKLVIHLAAAVAKDELPLYVEAREHERQDQRISAGQRPVRARNR